MRALLPAPSDPAAPVDLAAAYAVAAPGQRQLRVNFVAGADGGGAVDGKSDPLSGPADKELFRVLRGLADVVLVGAGTVRGEGYGPVRNTGSGRRPPLAVITSQPNLDPGSPLFTEAAERTLLLTTAQADTGSYADVANVVICGETRVDLAAAVDALADRGLTRVLCEGGPAVFAQLAAADLVDELCLTLAPRLTGPGGPRITTGSPWSQAVPLMLVGLLEDEGFLFCRYATDRGQPPSLPPPA